MRKDIKELKELAIEEAIKLKDKITEEERERLNYKTFRSKNYNRCVYGQITGDCTSNRAVNLIKASCEKVYCNTKIISSRYNNLTGATLNGSPKKSNRYNYWSPIEVWVAQKGNQGNGNNKILIDFLKNIRRTLKFK